MHPRGPDDERIWQAEGAALAHRRLADLDRRATEPLHFPCGRHVAVVNGEIYNFESLRAQRQDGAYTPVPDTSFPKLRRD